ncbi:transposase InsO family protein [Paraburkholderia sp. 40]
MWAYHYKVRIDFGRPAKRTDKCCIETFNGSSPDECLNLHSLESLAEAKREFEAWRRDYNETRLHGLRPAAEGMKSVED